MTKQLPTLVMLAGTLCDRRLFAKQYRALRGVADVRLIDFQRLAPKATDKQGLHWLNQLLVTLPAKFSLVGFSLGGIYALEMLRQAPERIERLAMVASNAQAASPKGERKGIRLKRLWQRRAGGGADAVLASCLPGYFHYEASLQRHARLLSNMAQNTPTRSAVTQFYWAGSRPKGLETLSRFSGPLLIVSGANDRLCPPSWQAAMASTQPKARWLSLPRVGHFVPLEAPSQLTNALALWFKT